MVDLNAVCNVVGNETGYQVHARELCEALIKEGVNLSIESPPFNAQGLERELIEAIGKTPKKGTPNLVINLPFYWGLKSAQGNTLGFCVFEGSKVSVGWKHCMEKPHVKQVWVPSQHVKDACLEAGITKPLYLVPHGVDTELFNPEVKPIPALKSDLFTFLYSGGWSQGSLDRRAVDVLLTAFSQEFKKGEARLILKINSSYQNPYFNVAQAVRDLSPEGGADVVLINKNIPFNELPALYKSADCYVFPTKAEGFGLTALESMACGVPCIATAYGGQVSFVSQENGWLIDYDLKPATDNQLFYEEALWGTPRIEHLQKLLRQAKESPELVKEKGLKARKTAEQFTWRDSAQKALQALSELK